MKTYLIKLNDFNLFLKIIKLLKFDYYLEVSDSLNNKFNIYYLETDSDIKPSKILKILEKYNTKSLFYFYTINDNEDFNKEKYINDSNLESERNYIYKNI